MNFAGLKANLSSCSPYSSSFMEYLAELFFVINTTINSWFSLFPLDRKNFYYIL